MHLNFPPFPAHSLDSLVSCFIYNGFCSHCNSISANSLSLVSLKVSVAMEELFQYMKTLRSQINDAADQAEKISFEEYMLCTTVETLQKDLDLAKDKTRLLNEETHQMMKVKNEICSQILEKQRKIALLQSDSSTLSQTLEFMQQERLSLSKKLVDKRAYYKKVGEDISEQLRQQQESINTQHFGSETRRSLVNEKAGGAEACHDDVGQTTMMDIEDAQAKFDQMAQSKESTILENNKLKQSLELMKTKIMDFKQELREMDESSLEKELQALISDNDVEVESQQALHHQMMRLKEFSQTIVCSCGEVYNVKLDT